MKQEAVYRIVCNHPGSTINDIINVAVKPSRTARWFGEHSIITAMFGPTVGGVSAALMRLEREGRVWSRWGEPNPDRQNTRPRHYYAYANGGPVQ